LHIIAVLKQITTCNIAIIRAGVSLATLSFRHHALGLSTALLSSVSSQLWLAWCVSRCIIPAAEHVVLTGLHCVVSIYTTLGGASQHLR